MINFPPVSAFLDYLVVYVYKKFANSARPFYSTLFVTADSLAKEIDENDDAEREKIRFLQVKTMYEKFCYVN